MHRCERFFHTGACRFGHYSYVGEKLTSKVVLFYKNAENGNFVLATVDKCCYNVDC